VTVIDDFSTGKIENIQHLIGNPRSKIVREDLKKPHQLKEIVAESDLIFHLAANPEVRVGQTAPRVHFEENVLTTFNLLETLRESSEGKVLVFASTSTVYGNASEIPTPEDYSPMIPISTYGASKLASEALIASYAYTFNHRTLILRLANIVGSRSDHGVIVDFIKKIQATPEELEILGDGNQEKSYLYISDLVSAVLHLTECLLRDTNRVGIYNVGSNDKVTVKEIATIVADEMKKSRIRFRYTGGVDGGGGWKGDVKVMQLSVRKLLKTGWKARYTSSEAIRLATRDLLAERRIRHSA
jgi:UDP-glucose 4-epimerase